MTPSIRVDKEVYDFLKNQAEPFVDTPNSVLRRLLNIEVDAPAAGVNGRRQASKQRTNKPRAVSRRRTRKRSRAPAGALLPEIEYVAPLLTALEERGGSAPVRDVIESVGKKLNGNLTPVDKERIVSGAVRWHNRTQFVRLRLVEEGLIAKDSPRGIWALTDSGRDRVQSSRRTERR